ncbi:PREDICTED: probable E3 ubiquitin-protein ligase rbrA [Camelina sativa]|uniref:RBR-type E3 ubiquitin transferase n=1 Tax=Camelina sativa TaxID=90675 RepID=A0ABM0TT94_CAMSA|nr:PREDICTED: probable E3 ubiquitin-protein ligase rbrA [Camelina sativa]
MERYEVGFVSKKQRVTKSSSAKYVDTVVYKLYFKGLVSNDIAADITAEHNGKKMAMAGFGVVICNQKDELLFEIKEPVNDAKINIERVEIRALVRGLSEALDLGIKKLVIYCDDSSIYQNIMIGKCDPKKERVVEQLLEQVYRLLEKFDSSRAILVCRNNIKFVFNLAKEAIVSQTSTASEVKGEVCVICLEETMVDRMFFVGKCLHRYCFPCVNQFVEVKLQNGTVPTCLDNECKLELSLKYCSKVLKPKVIQMWKHKMKEDSIPVAERIYCPYLNCSTLMSKTAISRSDQSNDAACVKCAGLFCIDCKVPSHSGLSCTEYQELHPYTLVDDDLKLKSLAQNQKWRQCVKCRHLIELNLGCNHMICRCGYQFCYRCGVEWKKSQVICPTGCSRTADGDFDYNDGDDHEGYWDDLYADFSPCPRLRGLL